MLQRPARGAKGASETTTLLSYDDLVDDFLAASVDDGFLPLLADEFKATYGADSFFVLATADLFTTGLARAMERAGRLPRPDTVTMVGQAGARQALAMLLAAAEADEALWDEALGLAPLGALRQAVDAVLSIGAFERWLRAFQSGDFGAASAGLE